MAVRRRAGRSSSRPEVMPNLQSLPCAPAHRGFASAEYPTPSIYGAARPIRDHRAPWRAESRGLGDVYPGKFSDFRASETVSLPESASAPAGGAYGAPANRSIASSWRRSQSPPPAPAGPSGRAVGGSQAAARPSSPQVARAMAASRRRLNPAAPCGQTPRPWAGSPTRRRQRLERRHRPPANIAARAPRRLLGRRQEPRSVEEGGLPWGTPARVCVPRRGGGPREATACGGSAGGRSSSRSSNAPRGRHGFPHRGSRPSDGTAGRSAAASTWTDRPAVWARRDSTGHGDRGGRTLKSHGITTWSSRNRYRRERVD